MTSRRDMARAVSQQRPSGIVPQRWAELARVDDDPDALSWYPGWGWVVDVTITAGDGAGEGPIPCRVLTSFAASLNGRVEPVVRGQEGLLVYPGGDPNVQPVFVGFLQNPEGGAAPTTVNGLPVDEALALATHIVVSPFGVQAQHAGSIHVASAATHTISGAGVELGALGATQPFVRGLALASAMGTFLTVLGTAFTQLATVLLLGAPVQAACTAAAQACLTLAQRLVVGDVLSARVRGE